MFVKNQELKPPLRTQPSAIDGSKRLGYTAAGSGSGSTVGEVTVSGA